MYCYYYYHYCFPPPQPARTCTALVATWLPDPGRSDEPGLRDAAPAPGRTTPEPEGTDGPAGAGSLGGALRADCGRWKRCWVLLRAPSMASLGEEERTGGSGGSSPEGGGGEGGHDEQVRGEGEGKGGSTPAGDMTGLWGRRDEGRGEGYWMWVRVKVLGEGKGNG